MPAVQRPVGSLLGLKARRLIATQKSYTPIAAEGAGNAPADSDVAAIVAIMAGLTPEQRRRMREVVEGMADAAAYPTKQGYHRAIASEM